MRRAWLGAAAALLLLAAGCDREPTRTVVLSGERPSAPEARAMGGPAASPLHPAPVSQAANAVAAPPPPVAADAVVPANAPAERASRPAPAESGTGDDGAALLAARTLAMPVAGVAPASLADMFDDARGGHRHEAIDILAPRGTEVYAVDDGPVAKLFTSKPGGLTVYQFDPAGRLAYYYAHLDRYAEGLKEGVVLRRGDLLGYVGTTGNAGNTPHLHFAVFRLGPERRWWEGDPVNPYPALRDARPAG